MRISHFQTCLAAWAGRPCTLTVEVADAGAQIRLTGILRPSGHPRSLGGWTLVPPAQHGGLAYGRRVPLDFEAMRVRKRLGGRDGDVLQFWSRPELRFHLALDPSALTAPAEAS